MRIGKQKLGKLICLAGLFVLVSAGCSTFEDIFGGGDDDETAVDISLTSPTNGAENQETSLTLTWSGNGTTYDVYLDKDNPPTTKVKNDNSTTSFDISALDGGTKYYWQVEATKDGTSEKSGVWSFTTKGSSTASKISFLETDDQNYPLVVAHENKEIILAKKSETQPFDGYMYTTPTGEKAYFKLYKNGLIESITTTDAKILFSNYENGMVDIAIVNLETGATTIKENVKTNKVPTQKIASLQRSFSLSPNASLTNSQKSEFLSVGINVVGCGVSVVQGLITTVTTGIGVVHAVADVALSCGSAVFSVIGTGFKQDWAKNTSTFLSVSACGIGSLGSCFAAVVDGNTSELKKVEDKEKTRTAEVEKAKKDLDDLGKSIDLKTGLVAYYPLTADAKDYSGNGNHGTANGGVTFGTNGATFDGVDDVVKVDDFSASEEKISFSFLVNYSSSKTENLPIIDKHGEYFIIIDKNSKKLKFYLNTAATSEGNTLEVGDLAIKKIV